MFRGLDDSRWLHTVAIAAIGDVAQQRAADALVLVRRVDAEQRQVPVRFLRMKARHLPRRPRAVDGGRRVGQFASSSR